MGLRFRRRISISPGVAINLSKSGPSLSLGRRGAHVTLGHGHIRETVGIPGSGLSYTVTTDGHHHRRRRRQQAGGVGSLVLGLIFILYLIGHALLH